MASLSRLMAQVLEPRARQLAFCFCFDLMQNVLGTSVSSTAHSEVVWPIKSTDLSDPPMKIPLLGSRTGSGLNDECVRLVLLGITDVWSAIRKNCAVRVPSIAFQLMSMERVDSLINQLLQIVLGSNRTLRSQPFGGWKEQEGALLSLSWIIGSISTESRHQSSQNTSGTSVSDDIRGAFRRDETVITYHMGDRHRNLAKLPRSLVETLKPTLYQALRHDQLTIREYAAECLVRYVDLCDSNTRVLIFQEVMSKLNRMSQEQIAAQEAMQSDLQVVELLEASEAEGLLDIVAKLAPCLPVAFLLKHWKVIYPTLEKYVMHIASSVRQKSSGVVLSLVQRCNQVCTSEEHKSSRELQCLVLLAISGKQVQESQLCWQQREGRLLSIDLLVNWLGTDTFWAAQYQIQDQSEPLLLRMKGDNQKRIKKSSSDDFWAQEFVNEATWLLEKELPSPPVSVFELLNAYISSQTAGEMTTNMFWKTVLRGWLEHTKSGFLSNQFELRRISRQILPGLLRLVVWFDQIEELELESAFDPAIGSHWRWACLHYLLVHLRFVHECIQISGSSLQSGLQERIQTAQQAAWDCAVLLIPAHSSPQTIDAETIASKVQTLVMLFLSYAGMHSKFPGTLLLLLNEAVNVIHSNIPTETQAEPYCCLQVAPNGSLDRQLSVAVVRLLPALTAVLRLCIEKNPTSMGHGQESRHWLCLERITLSWLTTDDMFRWITVSRQCAQRHLLKAIIELLSFMSCELIRHEIPRIQSHVEAALGYNSAKLSANVRSSAMTIYLLIWKHTTDERVLRNVLELVRQEATVNPPVLSRSLWDDWDEEGSQQAAEPTRELDTLSSSDEVSDFANVLETWTQETRVTLHSQLASLIHAERQIQQDEQSTASLLRLLL